MVEAGGQPLTAADLQRALGRTHQSNLKKVAEELVAADALTKAPAEGRRGPGRPPQDAFAFAEGEQERFEDLFEQLETPGDSLVEGAEVVVVDAHEDELEKGETLWSLLSQKGTARGARPVKQIDMAEEGTRFLFEFTGPGAVHEAMDLMAALKARKLDVRRGRVSKVTTIADMRRVARRRIESIQRSREQLGTTQTRPHTEV